MDTTIERAVFRGQPCLTLESGTLRVVLLPDAGGKAASLVYKPSGKEFLLQGRGETYRTAPYAGDFLKGDMSGFDDMFPTIDRCFYADYPWAGTELPDHGEVWPLKWDARAADGRVTLKVNGVRLPYTLEKTVSLRDAHTVRFSYVAANPTDFDMNFLWAAHLMLVAQKGCRHAAPEGMKAAVCAYSEGGPMGRYGDTFDFPYVPQADGGVYDASYFRGEDADDFQKFYFRERMSEGWYCLYYPDGHILRLEFPVETVPYFSAVNAEGGSFNLRCVHLEPCTAPFDRPDVARLHGKNSVMKAKSAYRWHLDITVGIMEAGR